MAKPTSSPVAAGTTHTPETYTSAAVAVPPKPSPVATPRGPSLLKKITLKTVCGSIAKPTEPRALFRVAGISHSIKTGESNFGAFVGFQGSFTAINLETGERFSSGTCYLPKMVEEMLYSAMQAAQSADASNTIQFALEVGVKPHPTSPVGYEITVKPLIDLAPNDAVAQLAQLIEPAAQLEHMPIA